MERIKHHYCWVKAVGGAAPPVQAGQAQGGADVQIGLATPCQPGHGGTGPIVVAPNYGTVEPIALHGRPLPPIAASSMVGQPQHQFGTVPPNELSTASLAALSSADLISLGAVPHYGTVPPGDLPSEGVAALRMTDLPASGGAGGQVADYGTVPPGALSAQGAAPFKASAPLIFAGATFAGAWQFEAPTAGRQTSADGGVSIVFQPIVGTREDALAWLYHSEAGRQWSRDALAINLMSFAAIGEL